MAKTTILLLITGAIIFLCSPTKAHAWWWSDDDNDDDQQQQVEKQLKAEITHLQTQLDVAQHAKDTWQLVAFILGITCVVFLVGGAAIGSHARKRVQEVKQ